MTATAAARPLWQGPSGPPTDLTFAERTRPVRTRPSRNKAGAAHGADEPAASPGASQAASQGASRIDAEEAAQLEALLDGHRAAWNGFVQRYARVIYAAIQRRLVPAGRAGDVEDVAQDVFVRLCNRDFHVLRNYDSRRAKLTTWLTVIATSVSIDHLRKNSRQMTDIDALPESLLSVEPKMPERVKIPAGLLSPRQAQVLELLYRRDLDPAEAAEILGVDPQTIRSTHHKALVKLRKYFQDSPD